MSSADTRPPALPRQVEHIDPTWLTAALRHGGWNAGLPDVTVTDVAIEPLAKGSAFLGSLATLTPAYDPDGALGPASLVAKLPPTDDGAQTVGRMLNVWFREAMFYARLAENLPGHVSVPRCHFNHVEEDTGRSVLLLDDLAPATPGDQIAGATAEQARAAVEQLARYQATWWGRPRTEALAWVPGIDNPSAGVGLKAAMHHSIDAFETRFGDLLPARSVGWNRRFIDVVDQWLGGLASRPMTIAHADYRLENLLFHPEGNVTIIDWQTAMYTGGVTDLAFLLGTSLDVELRRALEDELLDLYISELRRSGVHGELVSSVEDDYRGSMLWWMAMLGNNLATIDTPDERSTALFDAMLSRLHAAAIDNDAGALIDLS